MVAARSGGTPLLVHELLDDLVDRGVIVKERDVWRMDPDAAPLARSATDLIRARLDRVEHHDRAVLEALAVVNAPTDPSIVAALLGIDADDVERSLDRLRGHRLAIETEADPSGSPAAIWTVDHPVIAEVVEAALLDAARRRLHRRLLEVDTDAPLGRRRSPRAPRRRPDGSTRHDHAARRRRDRGPGTGHAFGGHRSAARGVGAARAR